MYVDVSACPNNDVYILYNFYWINILIAFGILKTES